MNEGTFGLPKDEGKPVSVDGQMIQIIREKEKKDGKSPRLPPVFGRHPGYSDGKIITVGGKRIRASNLICDEASGL